MANFINVMVVDDSAFMRKVITDILEDADDIKVTGTAKNGLEALEKVKLLNPDVITLDVEMPSMDGLSCLKELQKLTMSPVIMLSGLTTSGAKATIEALEAGAIDFITKPTNLFEISGEQKKKEIVEKVRMAKSIVRRSVPEKTVFRRSERTAAANKLKEDIKRSGKLESIVAIGTSTGGPKALQEVVPYIPGDVPAALMVVQHMPPGFTKSLADRLNTLSGLLVKEAEDGDRVQAGYAYIAPGDYHMLLSKSKDGGLSIKLTKDPSVGGHRPAVNVMMNSIAESGFSRVIGVIMTGMGSDGSEGVVNIKKMNNGVIISQDENSCVVYGMPKAAVNTGAVDEVVPLKQIADVIVKYLGVYR